MTHAHLFRTDYVWGTVFLAAASAAVATFLHVLRLIWPGRRRRA